MHVYSGDINELDSLTQEDKEETDDGHSPQRVQIIEIIPQKCKGNSQALSKKEMVTELKKLKLNSSGSPKVLCKRLDMYHIKRNPCTSGDGGRKNMFDFYVVIDFEATCDNQQNTIGDNQEIIEFPAILLNCKNGKLEDEFQSYCRPTLHPLITDYCTKLTGITQDVVNKAPLFQKVFASFNDWLQKKKLGSKFSFAVVTDGTKDMGHFLKTQCELSNIIFPDYGKHWINIRKMFSKFYKIEIQHRARMNNDTVLNAMILEIGSKFKGRAHSGLDDARNIACIVQRLLEDGASLIPNEKLPEESAENKNGKRLFALPVLQSEFESIKANFPSKRSPTNATEKTRMTEPTNKCGATGASATLREETPKEKTLNTATKKKTPATISGKKGSKIAQTAQLAQDNVGKNGINGTISKTAIEATSSVNILTKPLIKDVPSKSKVKTPVIERKPEVPNVENQAMTATKTDTKKTSVNTPSKGIPAKSEVKENPATSRLVKTLAKGTPAKTCAEEDKINNSAKENPIKINRKKTPTQTSSEQTAEQTRGKKNEAKESPSVTALENAGEKSRKQRPVKVCPAQAAVKRINGNTLAKISGTSNHEKTAEFLSKELKLAKTKFYMRIQRGILTKKSKVAKKNMEVLKKCLNAARSKETACVSKPPIEDEATTRMSNVAEEQQAVGASGKGACKSQKMTKKKVSSGKKEKQSESKGNLRTVLHDMKPSLHVGTTANFCKQDVKLITTKELLFDKVEESLFFHRLNMALKNANNQ